MTGFRTTYRTRSRDSKSLGLIHDQLSFTTTLLIMVAFSALLPTAAAWNFTTAIDQCANVTMTWAGGVAPYEILLVPVGHVVPEIRTIINYQNIQSTTFSFPLTFPNASQFVAVLSDSQSGPGSGGTSGVLTVGPSPTDDSSCLATQQVKPEFYFYLDPPAPSQCQDWQISWPLAALTPAAAPPQNISVWAVVPGGATFAVPLPITSDPDDPTLDCSDWDVDLKEGTGVMLVAGYDYTAKGGIVNGRGKGGSTDILVVGPSKDNSCLTHDVPITTTFGAATVNAPGPTSTSSSENPTNSKAKGGASRLSSLSTIGVSMLALLAASFTLL